MAGNYTKKSTTKNSGSKAGRLLLIFVSALTGYLAACFLDFNQLNEWMNHLAALHSTNHKEIKKVAELPKPKFEFYTLLSNDKVIKKPESFTKERPSSQEPVTEPPKLAKQSDVVNANSKEQGSYLVQIASFKNMHDAERMKVELVMKGFEVGIATATAQNVTWYRVIIGPFTSKQQAQQAQQAFARSEHIVGMIRRMDA